MPTLDADITVDWVDIKTSLSLVEGSTYVTDNVFGGPVYIREGDAEPSAQVGHPIDLNESRRVTITAEKLWVRSSTADSKIVLTLEA